MALNRPYASLISTSREYDRLNPTKRGIERNFARGLMQLRGFEPDVAPIRIPSVKKVALGAALRPRGYRLPGLK